MILGFVCCSNPSGSTNNNTLDYCEICEGVQDASHEHDYCLECDGVQGSDHEHQVVTPEPTEPTWFKEATIGGENSSFSFMYADCNEIPNFGDAETIANAILDQYIKYVESFSLNNELSSVTLDQTVSSFDDLIGSINNNYYAKDGLNDVCAPAIEKITENISSSGAVIDKTLFKMYYEAISNEAYRIGYGAEIMTKKALDGSEIEDSFEEQYIKSKANCSKYDGREQIPFEYKYFYLETGELNPEVVEKFCEMINHAATKMGYEDATDLHDFVKLSIITSAVKGAHDLTATWSKEDNEQFHTIESANCTTNEMTDVISATELVAPTKLNKSIFNNKNIDRELC